MGTVFLVWEIVADGVSDSRTLARQVMLLLDGGFATVLLRRDPSYIETAGKAGAALVAAAART